MVYVQIMDSVNQEKKDAMAGQVKLLSYCLGNTMTSIVPTKSSNVINAICAPVFVNFLVLAKERQRKMMPAQYSVSITNELLELLKKKYGEEFVKVRA